MNSKIAIFTTEKLGIQTVTASNGEEAFGHSGLPVVKATSKDDVVLGAFSK